MFSLPSSSVLLVLKRSPCQRPQVNEHHQVINDGTVMLPSPRQSRYIYNTRTSNHRCCMICTAAGLTSRHSQTDRQTPRPDTTAYLIRSRNPVHNSEKAKVSPVLLRPCDPHSERIELLLLLSSGVTGSVVLESHSSLDCEQSTTGARQFTPRTCPRFSCVPPPHLARLCFAFSTHSVPACQ